MSPTPPGRAWSRRRRRGAWPERAAGAGRGTWPERAAGAGRGRGRLVAGLLAGLMLGASVVLGGPAVAVAAPDPEETAPDPASLPVQVTIERLEPREVKPGTPITVVATLRNTGGTTTGELKIRLQRGQLLTSRQELAGADATPPSVLTRFAPTAPVPAIGPRQSRRVQYTCDPGCVSGDGPSDLKLLGVGVFPLALTVYEVQSGGGQRLAGEALTMLPSVAEVTPAPLRVAWLWPLLDRPHRLLGPAGGPPMFTDDALARSVARGGRLDRLLRSAEAVTGRVSLTLVVDPETIESLQLMTRPYRVGNEARSVPGTGTAAAAGWLRRLKAIAPRHQVITVPYGDPDVVALERAGLLDELGRPTAADQDLVDQVLGVATTRDLAWPPGGLLTDAALDKVVPDAATAVVLDAAALPGGVSRTSPTPSAVSPLPSIGGRASALVTDAGVQSVVARAAGFPGGQRVAEQRYLAELAMIVTEAPALPRTIVVAPPRRWDPNFGYASSVLADTSGTLPWLTALTAGAVLQDTRPADRGPLVYPATAARAEVPGNVITAVGEVNAMVADFRTALTNSDAAELLGPYRDGLRRAASSAWRGNAAAGTAYVAGMAAGIGALRGQVIIQKPFSGFYTLASAESPITVTVVNRLNRPVRVRIRIDTRNPLAFKVQPARPADIPANTRTTVEVLVSVDRAGTFAIKAAVTTPKGGVLGDRDPIPLTVRSTAYGSMALGITVAALAVLIAALIFRMIRRLRAPEDGEAVPAGGPGDRSAP